MDPIGRAYWAYELVKWLQDNEIQIAEHEPEDVTLRWMRDRGLFPRQEFTPEAALVVAGTMAMLKELHAGTRSVVSMLTGIPDDELNDLGGLPEGTT